ncbi:hypothetical protein CDAR_551791 [Caerostris darwini]|uniref:DUF4283 domain-containing protein n=1 Tax=Caerostris darwini TaxID=1538125 RepID=A0AAV4Q9I8_9ARAC|nr:hypothetical protein CDAR_551791 [Caerostris darwini]
MTFETGSLLTQQKASMTWNMEFSPVASASLMWVRLPDIPSVLVPGVHFRVIQGSRAVPDARWLKKKWNVDSLFFISTYSQSVFLSWKLCPAG